MYGVREGYNMHIQAINLVTNTGTPWGIISGGKFGVGYFQ